MNARVAFFTELLSAGVSEAPIAIRRLVIQFRRDVTQYLLKVLSQQSALSTDQTNEKTHTVPSVCQTLNLPTLAPSGQG